MKKTLQLILLVTILTSCTGTKMDVYEKSQVDIISSSMTSGGEILVKFTPMLETLYFCPGARKRTTDDGKIIYDIVRCGIKEKCEVSVKAEQESGASRSIAIPADATDIYLGFSDGTVKL